MTTIIGELRRRMRGLCTGLALLLCTSSTMSAQIGPSPAGRAAKQNLAWLDFTATPVGDFPSNIAMLDGVMNVVDVNGRHMLRASSTSAFLIQLPQVLPVDFTIEVDLIPKVGANPADIGFEGSPTINQGSSSANILWHSHSLQVVGGAVDNFETRFPESLAPTLEGKLTRVTIVVEGTIIKVYTNGRLLSTLPNRKFMRGPVLRVYLGGQDDGTAAVYLASLIVRPGANSATQGSPTGNPSPSSTGGGTGTGASGTVTSPPSHTPPINKTAPSNVASFGLSVGPRQGWGANISWLPFPGSVQYVVGRRLAGQSFASIGTVTNNTAGNFKADIAVRTSTHYDYQVTAVDANGTILAISAIQGIDTPAQYPSVQGLSATAAPLQTVNVTMAGQVTSVQGQVMTYMWDNSPFIGNQFATLDHITTDPATGQPTSVRSWNTLNPVQPGAQFGVAAGTSARFCVAAIPDPDDATNLASPTCLTTTLAPAPRTSTTNTRVTNALNDAPAPTVTLTPTAGGIKVAYTLVPGAVNHTMCRESPAGSACMPIGAPGVTVLNNVATVWDLALSPATYAYRVTATQADGHYGESATTTAAPGPLPAPQNVRVSNVSMTPYQVTLEWDPVQYEDFQGMKSITTYQVPGGASWSAQTVNGTQVTIPLSSAQATYDWHVSAVLPAPAGASSVTSAFGSVSYTTRYRLVVLGFWAHGNTTDVGVLDGNGDEVYLTTAVNVTDRSLSSSAVTTIRSSTFGDIFGRPNRIKAGTLTANGGLKSFNPVPNSLDLSAPVNLSWPQFPYQIWEGPLDNQAMVVVHTSIWEEGSTNHTQLAWVNKVSSGAQGAYAGPSWPRTLSALKTLRDANDIGPTTGEPVVRCVVDMFSRTSPDDCSPGEDRPIGLIDWGDNKHWSDRDQFVVLTHDAIERALLTSPAAQPIITTSTTVAPRVGAGVLAVNFNDSRRAPPFQWGEYVVYLKVERVP